jgi:hypothetical protein
MTLYSGDAKRIEKTPGRLVPRGVLLATFSLRKNAEIGARMVSARRLPIAMVGTLCCLKKTAHRLVLGKV